MTSSADFRSAPFRRTAQKIEEEIEALKVEAVSAIKEDVHVHPHRVGMVNGLRHALEILRDAEKEIMGDKS